MEKPIGILPGQYYDAEAGLNYNLNRDYNPAIGRYVQADPIGLWGGINPFVYTGNNPIDWIDPFGWSRDSQAAWRNLGATLGFLLSLPVDVFEDLSTFGAGVIANPATTGGMVVGGAALGTAIDAFLTGPMLAQNNDDSCPPKGTKGKTFRGGKKQSRDYWGKYEKETELKRWWHRQGKKEFGGHDIEPDQLDKVYQYWKDLGSPRVK
ncbi:MAG: RHS repeat-associated core domain-containing protein [Desulfuromonadales bacterium]|nr:RHS repeat-associated core domain-containing protein [Desulfuromonadales bacterium]